MAWNKVHPGEHNTAARKFYRSPKGQAYRKQWIESATGQWSRFRASAKHRRLEVTISFETFAALRSLPCCYCGKPLAKTGSGLDRRDNTQGYTPGNCVPCCYLCNTNKGTLEGMGFKYPRTIELMLELRGGRHDVQS